MTALERAKERLVFALIGCAEGHNWRRDANGRADIRGIVDDIVEAAVERVANEQRKSRQQDELADAIGSLPDQENA
jgi:hypothetical protein